MGEEGEGVSVGEGEKGSRAISWRTRFTIFFALCPVERASSLPVGSSLSGTPPNWLLLGFCRASHILATHVGWSAVDR